MRWDPLNRGTKWKCSMVVNNALGLASTVDLPTTGFGALPINKWYRWETDTCLKTNQILEVRLTVGTVLPFEPRPLRGAS